MSMRSSLGHIKMPAVDESGFGKPKPLTSTERNRKRRMKEEVKIKERKYSRAYQYVLLERGGLKLVDTVPVKHSGEEHRRVKPMLQP